MMFRIYRVVYSILFVSEILFSQVDTVWTSVFDAGGEEYFNAVKQTADGGFIAVGSSDSYVYEDEVLIVRFDPDGRYLWHRTYSFISKPSEAMDIVPTGDGDFLIIGNFYSSQVGDDAHIWRITSEGDTVWTRRYSNVANQYFRFVSIESISNGNYRTMGVKQGTLWLVEFTGDGTEVWNQYYQDVRGATAIVSSEDGEFTVLRTRSDPRGYKFDDFSLCKVNELGDTLWTRFYDSDTRDQPSAMIGTHDLGYLLVGQSRVDAPEQIPDWEEYTMVIKTDRNGDLLWTRHYDILEEEDISDIERHSDSSYILAGAGNSGDYDDIILFAINEDGDSLWTSSGIGRSYTDYVADIKLLPNGEYILAGFSEDAYRDNDGFLVLVSESITVVPAAPRNLTAATGNGEVVLTWDPNIEDDFLRYRIYGGTSPSPTTPVDSTASIADTTKIIGDLTNGTTYYYRVTAVDNSLNESTFSNEVSVTPEDLTPPAAPRNLTAATGNGEVVLTWDPNIEDDFLRYRIYGGTVTSPTTAIDSTESALDTTVSIPGLNNGTTYYFHITALDANFNESDFSNKVSATPLVLAVENPLEMPTSFSLHPNYPNPFNLTSVLQYDLPKAGYVRISVWDIKGREITRLVDSHLDPGYHQVIWDGKDSRGQSVPTGIYIARLVTPQYTKSIKMLLIK